MPIKIAVDAMGGDDAPGVVVEGAISAAKSDADIEVMLFGPIEQLRPLIPDDCPDSVTLVDAPDVIGMAESPSTALRKKLESSIHRGIGAHKAGKADAFVSAGAPDGTAARPVWPSASLTSASIVGLPRESRIWRA